MAGEWCGDSVTRPVLLQTTWVNVREHAAGPPAYWGSRVVGSNPAVPTKTRIGLGKCEAYINVHWCVEGVPPESLSF
jgi:hypothetical protein